MSTVPIRTGQELAEFATMANQMLIEDERLDRSELAYACTTLGAQIVGLNTSIKSAQPIDENRIRRLGEYVMSSTGYVRSSTPKGSSMVTRESAIGNPASRILSETILAAFIKTSSSRIHGIKDPGSKDAGPVR